MRKLFYLIILSLVGYGCENGCENNVLDEYYVKYEVTVSSIHSNDKFIEVTITNEDSGKSTFDARKTFSMTVGPVKKGFIAD